jgi:Cdc6-like AAA superfamily ATPase
MAIDLLRETVELAALLDISQDSVNASHVRKTRSKSLFGSADNESLDMIDRLHPQQRILLGIIIWMAMLDHKAVKGSEILEEYGNYFDRVGPVNGLRKLQPRRVHTYLEELVEKSILGKVKTSGGRSQGIDNIYSLKMDPYKLGPHILASQWQCFLSAKESLADISFRREILKAGPPESWLACSPILDVEENKFRDRLIIRSAIS